MGGWRGGRIVVCTLGSRDRRLEAWAARWVHGVGRGGLHGGQRSAMKRRLWAVLVRGMQGRRPTCYGLGRRLAECVAAHVQGRWGSGMDAAKQGSCTHPCAHLLYSMAPGAVVGVGGVGRVGLGEV